MYTPLRTLFAPLLLVTSHAFSATVQDENGTFTFDKTPLRIFLNILILIALI
ncbi:Fe3+-citrate ABC transporter substrate-binding protein [Klebsiella pneumoniae]|uniref:Fe3+-citrate ABC transporter substrate-binding protein n=1 Tax=Klebsiella pneumoniae TaxID=573 RepID=UPI00190B6AB8|nr:Fe3+-citrate ABC transporter substrate-binding protein [Klebsiella pneumoniae]